MVCLDDRFLKGTAVVSRNDFQAVILDMDGVITQTARIHALAWKQLFDEFLRLRGERAGESHEPFDIDRDYREYVDGKPRYEGVQSFLESRGIGLAWGEADDASGQETVCGLGNRKNEIFQELLAEQGVDVYPDTVEQIDDWKLEGLRVAVISSSRNCAAVLNAANLLDRFDAKVDGNDLDPLRLKGKPAADMFLEAARQLGVGPSRTIVVEDAISGVRAARAGQFGLVVAVARDHGAEDLREAGADVVVQDLRDLDLRGERPVGKRSRSDSGPGRDSPVSAVERADEIAGRLKDRKLALFLDYDGTLTPIVRRPEEATLSDEMRSLLVRLAELCTVTIVSGRDREDAQEMVGIESLVYAGSHGFDIRGPEGLAMEYEGAEPFLVDLDEAERRLRDAVAEISGVHVERKRFAIAIHYREVEGDDDLNRIERAVDDVCGEFSSLRKKGGKKIFEVQPDVEWDKGRAVRWLVEALGLDQPETVVMYVGDDVTDEDAFRALRRDNSGIGVRVTATNSDTDAEYFLRDCDQVRQFLGSLLTLLREREETR